MSIYRHDDRVLMQPNFEGDLEAEEDVVVSNQHSGEEFQQFQLHLKKHCLSHLLAMHHQKGRLNMGPLSCRESIIAYMTEKESRLLVSSDQNHSKAESNRISLDTDHSIVEVRRQIMTAYYEKRLGMRALAKKPGFFFNEDMILVSSSTNDEVNNHHNNEADMNEHNGDDNALNNENNFEERMPINFAENNNAENLNFFPQGLIGLFSLFGNDPNHVDEEEEVRILSEQLEREAAQVVANVVRKYRENNVPEDDFMLIRVTQTNNANNTLPTRRIIIFILAVITAFVCIMLQTLHLLTGAKTLSEENGLDLLLPKIMHIRDFRVHATNCGKELDRSKAVRIIKNIGGKKEIETFDCSDEVLHIPSVSQMYLASSTSQLDPIHFARNGINTTWTFPCNTPLSSYTPIKTNRREHYLSSSCFPLKRLANESCIPESKKVKSCKSDYTLNTNQASSFLPKTQECFRGIHDGMIDLSEIEATLAMARDLVKNGGTHLNIHRNISRLTTYVPSVMLKLKRLLEEEYKIKNWFQPIAFRVSITLPINPDKWIFQPGYFNFTEALNLTTLAELEATITRHNYKASVFKLANSKPFRDPCILQSDLEAVGDFDILTSIFLSGEEDFSGGASFFLDDHSDNSNPRKKIRRGMVVDGTKGRILISTGGFENRRCKFPTREGIRAVLQVWWSCNTN